MRVLEHTFVTDLIVRDARVVGTEQRGADGITTRVEADAVILASGGAGQLYCHTTNPVVATGDGAAAAWRAGAELADVEFYQFHPTALALPWSFLVSEAVRGEGAVLRNAAGERFMVDVHPDAELAPRDVVARAITNEMAIQGGAPVLLDTAALGAEFLATRFPTIDAACRRAGFDWAREPTPVTPAAHYWMGGVVTNSTGRTSLPGLYAVGEVACTGAHGANRLASNSLLESVVFAYRAARDLPSNSAWLANAPPYEPRIEPSGVGTREVSTSTGVHTPQTCIDRRELQNLMWNSAGVHRSGERLEAAAQTLAGWRSVPSTSATISDLENRNLLEVAHLIVGAALVRRESRGAHFRSDFPYVSAKFARHLVWAREVPVPC